MAHHHAPDSLLSRLGLSQLRHRADREQGFVLSVRVLVLGLIITATLLAFAWSGRNLMNTLWHFNTRQTTIALGEAWQDRMTSESRNALSIFVPTKDVNSVSNADGHAIDFYAQDANKNAYFWEYTWSAATQTISRYTYVAPGKACPAACVNDGVVALNVTAAPGWTRYTADQFNNAALFPVMAALIAQTGAPAPIAINYGYPNDGLQDAIVGGNYIVRGSVAFGVGGQTLFSVPQELTPGIAPSVGTSVVVGVNQAPPPPISASGIVWFPWTTAPGAVGSDGISGVVPYLYASEANYHDFYTPVFPNGCSFAVFEDPNGTPATTEGYPYSGAYTGSNPNPPAPSGAYGYPLPNNDSNQAGNAELTVLSGGGPAGPPCSAQMTDVYGQGASGPMVGAGGPFTMDPIALNFNLMAAPWQWHSGVTSVMKQYDPYPMPGVTLNDPYSLGGSSGSAVTCTTSKAFPASSAPGWGSGVGTGPVGNETVNLGVFQLEANAVNNAGSLNGVSLYPIDFYPEMVGECFLQAFSPYSEPTQSQVSSVETTGSIDIYVCEETEASCGPTGPSGNNEDRTVVLCSALDGTGCKDSAGTPRFHTATITITFPYYAGQVELMTVAGAGPGPCSAGNIVLDGSSTGGAVPSYNGTNYVNQSISALPDVDVEPVSGNPNVGYDQVTFHIDGKATTLGGKCSLYPVSPIDWSGNPLSPWTASHPQPYVRIGVINPSDPGPAGPTPTPFPPTPGPTPPSTCVFACGGVTYNPVVWPKAIQYPLPGLNQHLVGCVDNEPQAFSGTNPVGGMGQPLGKQHDPNGSGLQTDANGCLRDSNYNPIGMASGESVTVHEDNYNTASQTYSEQDNNCVLHTTPGNPFPWNPGSAWSATGTVGFIQSGAAYTSNPCSFVLTDDTGTVLFQNTAVAGVGRCVYGISCYILEYGQYSAGGSTVINYPPGYPCGSALIGCVHLGIATVQDSYVTYVSTNAGQSWSVVGAVCSVVFNVRNPYSPSFISSTGCSYNPSTQTIGLSWGTGEFAYTLIPASQTYNPPGGSPPNTITGTPPTTVATPIWRPAMPPTTP